MEDKIIEKIRNNKRYLKKLYKLIKKNTDMEAEIIDSESLQMLSLVSRIEEELTDIIYMIFDIKNSQKH